MNSQEPTVSLRTKLLFSLGLSIFLLWLAFRYVDWSTAKSPFTTISGTNFSIAIACVVLMQLTRWWRWTALTSPLGNVTLWEQFQISVSGSALITLLPMRLGELARPMLLRRFGEVPIASSLASTSVERVFDGLIISAIFFISVRCLPEDMHIPLWLNTSALLMASIFLSLSVLLVLLALFRPWLDRLLSAATSLLGTKAVIRLQALVGDAQQALLVLRSPAIFFQLLSSTTLFWLLNATVIGTLAHDFGWHLPSAAPWLISCIMILAGMLPSGPGLVGPFQAAVLISLSVFQVNATSAAMYGIALYVAIVVTKVALALPFLPVVIESAGVLWRQASQKRFPGAPTNRLE